MKKLGSVSRKYYQRDIKGFYMLYVLLAISIIFPYAWSRFYKKNPEKPILVEFKKDLPSSESMNNNRKNKKINKKSDNMIIGNGNTKTIYSFENLTMDQARKIGISNKLFTRIKKYIEKGGRIKRSEDILKIYGMDSSLWKRITENLSFASDTVTILHSKEISKSKVMESKLLNINTANEEEWIALPCIGEKLAERIIKYRESLGGFHQVNQIMEVFGIQDSSFQCILPYLKCEGEIRQIPLEFEHKAELEKHPYIRWKKAKLILNYLESHENITSIDELKGMYGVDQIWLDKIRPYVALNARKGKISSTVSDDPITIDAR